ncbi:MAG TPA: NAD-dependent epimerase/dehydratase family protein [Candidatus Dormibacteraeota bacterium]|nr:NAD-dependent epimerase/dehydratase family protein [Candidatus Dormibacteraeota bacterium]
MLIAVTGATGFVGGRVVESLARGGHHVLAFGRRPREAFRHGELAEYTQWNIAEGPRPALALRPIDAVVHCAGTVTDWGPTTEFDAVNARGTEAVLASFTAEARFVHLSTSSVYDHRRPAEPIDETAAYARRPLNAYVRTKVAAEHAVLRSGRQAIILRPHAIYGPGETKLLPRLLAARRFGHLLAVGDGRNRMSLTHIDNLVHAIELALLPRSPAGVYNVADSEAEPLGVLLSSLLVAFGLPPDIFYLPRRAAWPIASAMESVFLTVRASRPPLLTRYVVSQLASDCVLDTRRARTMLGYQPQRGYRDAFREVAVAAQAAPGP